jgi:hypothetical protein
MAEGGETEADAVSTLTKCCDAGGISRAAHAAPLG